MKEKTLHELAKENPDKTYNELTKIQEETRLRNAARLRDSIKVIAKGVCVTAAVRKDIQQNRPLTDTMDEKAYYELKNENSRLKERVEELDHSLAIALEVNESHQRYNGKLQQRLTEVEEENKKFHEHLSKKIENARKAGLQ
jgi:predicted  nucleic acid-binding Zn-ribbon protein